MNNEKTQAIDDGFCFWICGFIDGEGCFSISFRFRNKNKLGIDVQPSFSVAQKISKGHFQLLVKVKDFFKTGGIRGDKNCYKYETRNLQEIIKTVLPFFKKYPLKTDKQKDFEIFAEVCSRMQKKQHLNKLGLIEIIELIKVMNPSGKRRFSADDLISFLNKSDKLNLKKSGLEKTENILDFYKMR